MNNKNIEAIAVISPEKKFTLPEYLKSLNNISIDTCIDTPIDTPTNFSINSLEFHDNNYIEELNKHIEIINKIHKLNQLKDKKINSNLLNQKRKKYSYTLNHTLKNN